MQVEASQERARLAHYKVGAHKVEREERERGEKALFRGKLGCRSQVKSIPFDSSLFGESSISFSSTPKAKGSENMRKVTLIAFPRSPILTKGCCLKAEYQHSIFASATNVSEKYVTGDKRVTRVTIGKSGDGCRCTSGNTGDCFKEMMKIIVT